MAYETATCYGTARHTTTSKEGRSNSEDGFIIGRTQHWSRPCKTLCSAAQASSVLRYSFSVLVRNCCAPRSLRPEYYGAQDDTVSCSLDLPIKQRETVQSAMSIIWHSESMWMSGLGKIRPRSPTACFRIFAHALTTAYVCYPRQSISLIRPGHYEVSSTQDGPYLSNASRTAERDASRP